MKKLWIGSKTSGIARAPQAPQSQGAVGAAKGPPGRSSRRNPCQNKLFAGGGAENRRYATE